MKQLTLITPEDLNPIIDRLTIIEELLSNKLTQPGNESLLTRKALCEYLRVSENTLLSMDLPYIAVGRSYRYDLEEVKKKLKITSK